jgi:pimeloyl-ACP methyl ester carboxylesterase
VHGYDIREYELITKDNYKLKMHRIIHPEDYLAAAGSPGQQQQGEDVVPSKKKPYLLVHGLIGTSASFVLNIDDNYMAPTSTFKARKHIVEMLKARANTFVHEWKATSQLLQVNSAYEKRDRWAKHEKPFADLNEIIYDGDEINFAPEFRQAYRKFHLPKEALRNTSNSLAFTLANFGYDVWMINLRGNEYSKGYNGRLRASDADYWDFNIGTLVEQDLMAAIHFIQAKKNNKEDPIGLVTYSYSSGYVMQLLTKFPAYAERLQPIVMLAPTLMTGSRDKGNINHAVKVLNHLLSKNGPFPSLGRSFNPRKLHVTSLFSKLDEKIAWLACNLPVAGKLCRFMEAIIHGNSRQVSTIKGLVSLPARSMVLARRDNDCGQTSKAIVHQIFANVKQSNILPDFMPFAAIETRRRRLRQTNSGAVNNYAGPAGAALRRSVILVHSEADQVATTEEVDRIRSTALKTMTLLDYVVKVPEFKHIDFLFSRRNQYLINAEVVRQVLLYDYLAYQKYANLPSEVPLGIK